MDFRISPVKSRDEGGVRTTRLLQAGKDIDEFALFNALTWVNFNPKFTDIFEANYQPEGSDTA